MADRRGSVFSNYDTPLTKQEEPKYKLWKQKHAPHDSGEDYDLRGAFLRGETADQTKEEHGSDADKKPNHPTYSEESKYAQQGLGKEPGDPTPAGGRWGEGDPERGGGIYIPHGGLLKRQLKDEIAEATKYPLPKKKP